MMSLLHEKMSLSLLLRQSRLLLAASACLSLLVAAGCGTGEYERRMERGLGKIRTQSKFNDLFGPQQLEGVPVSVRMPMFFKDSPMVVGAMVNGQPVEERRVRPMLLQSPWLKLTYEALFDDPQGVKLPCYCYVGAIDMAGGGNPAADIQNELKQNWADFQGQTPDGRPSPWKTIRVESQQEFRTVGQNGLENYVQLPGVLEVYLHEEAGKCVIIVWRMPASIQQQVDLAKWAPLVCGCVSVQN